MAIRKDVKSVNIVDYQMPVAENIESINNCIDNPTTLSNYSNISSSKIEYVDFSLDNNKNDQNIDAQIKINRNNFENITKLKNQMNNEYKEIKEKYNDALSLKNEKIWYDNGVIMSNGDKPMTPEEYENLLLGNYSQMYTDANIVDSFYNNQEWQEKIKTYTNTYNEIFKKLTNSNKTENEYKKYMQSINNDNLMLTSALYALQQEHLKLKITQEEQNITNSQEYIEWEKNTNLSYEELEEKYNEYSSKYGQIFEVPNLATEIYEEYNPMWFCKYAEQLANQEGYDVEDVIDKQVVVPQDNFKMLYQNYEVMTIEEIQIYSYFFENKGREEAEEYLAKKQNELNQRIGYYLAKKEIEELSLNDEGKIAENLCNSLNVGIDGLGDGINSFFKNIENAIINDKDISINEYKIAYYIEYLQEQTKILDKVYQVGMATGNMLPSVTASFLTSLIAPELAPKVGQLLIGASAYGSSKHEALINNYSILTSILYGLLSAGSEVLTERIGGIIGIADNPSTNFILRMLQEGNEEFIQTYLMSGIDAVILNKPINIEELTNDAIKSLLIGALVAGNLNAYTGTLGGITVLINNNEININSNQLNQVMKQIQENPEVNLKDIISNINNETSETEKKLARYEELMNYFKQDEFKNLPIEKQQQLQEEFQTIIKNLEENLAQNNVSNANEKINNEINEEIVNDESNKTSEQTYNNYISEINIKTSNDEPVMVKINNIDSITIDDLEKIVHKDLVSFQMPNEEILSYDELIESISYINIYNLMPTDTQTKIEEGKLKDEILQTIKGQNYTDIQKIRKLYLELNKRVSYDPTYIYNNRNENTQYKNDEIYNQNLSFANITSNKVICKGWAELYKELLISSGIPANQINIVGGTKIGAHKWIEINLPNVGTIVADATENIKGSNDLINAKMGERTNGFIIKPPNKQGQRYRITTEYKNQDNITDLNNRMNAWKTIDESIGAIENGKYRSDILKEAKEIFGKFTCDEEITENILDAIFLNNVGGELNGLEYYNYIKNINVQVGTSNGINARFSFIKTSQGIDAVTILKYNGKYAAYSETYGKIVTNNRQKMIQYLKSINVLNKNIERLL